jgi:hypothetical protein
MGYLYTLNFHDQWKLLLAHVFVIHLMFYGLKKRYSKPRIDQGENNSELQRKRGTRVAFLLSSVSTQALNFILTIVFNYQYTPWIPSVFQQVMFSNYLHEVYIILRYKQDFSKSYFRFITIHHAVAVCIFVMWYCMISSQVVIINNHQNVGIMATLWEVCSIPSVLVDAWIAATVSNIDTRTVKFLKQRDPVDTIIFANFRSVY